MFAGKKSGRGEPVGSAIGPGSRGREPIQPLCYVGARVIKLKSFVSRVARRREEGFISACEGERPFESVAKRSFNVPVSLRTPCNFASSLQFCELPASARARK